MGGLFERRKVRQFSTAALVVFLLCLVGFHFGTASAAEPNSGQDRPALQKTVESGEGLSSRAQKNLFASRSKQDKGDFAGAAGVMEKWILAHPDNPHHLLYFNWAVSQLDLEQTSQALINLEKAVALEPQFARAWLRLGEAAYDLEQYSRAAEAFGLGYDLMPNPKPEIQYYSAVAWLLADEGQKSLDTLIGLLTNNRSTAILDWYQALVAAAVEADKVAEVRPWLEHCLVDFESEFQAWYLAYQLAVAEEDFERAAVMLTVASHLRPLSRNEFMQLGDLYASSGVPLQAARYYQHAVEFPETAAKSDDYVRLASAWLAAYRLEAARQAIDRGLASEESVRLLALLGDLNYSEEKYEEARTAFNQCVKLDPQYGRGWLMGGYCSLELGENAEARQSLEVAAEFSDLEKLARDLLKRID